MFQAMLADLMSRIKGARWIMVVGTDGVALETSSLPEDACGEIMAAEYSTLLRSCENVTVSTGGGELESFIFYTSEGRVILQFLTSEYFLLMGLDSCGNTGRAQFEVSCARGRFEQELVY